MASQIRDVAVAVLSLLITIAVVVGLFRLLPGAIFAGLFLLVAGGVHLFAPYQAARKAAMEEGNENNVADEWEIDATQIFGAVTAVVGLAILARTVLRM